MSIEKGTQAIETTELSDAELGGVCGGQAGPFLEEIRQQSREEMEWFAIHRGQDPLATGSSGAV